MSNTGTPASWAATTKVLLDAVKTTFGAAIVMLIFLGASLLGLVWVGCRNLSPETCGNIIYLLIGLIFITPIGLIFFRIWKPSGLAGPPPQPETKDITISNTKSFPET